MQLKTKPIHPNAIIPKYATEGAACFDLHAATVDGYHLTGSLVHAGYPIIIGTGLTFEVPPGHVMLIFSRSGHGFNFDTRLANCVGVIDSDYRGEVKVKLTCDVDSDDRAPMVINPGDRVAQAMIIPFPRVDIVVADDLSETARGTGGFGSTGA